MSGGVAAPVTTVPLQMVPLTDLTLLHQVMASLRSVGLMRSSQLQNTFCPRFGGPMMLSMCLTRAHGQLASDASGMGDFHGSEFHVCSMVFPTDHHVSRASGWNVT